MENINTLNSNNVQDLTQSKLFKRASFKKEGKEIIAGVTFKQGLTKYIALERNYQF